MITPVAYATLGFQTHGWLEARHHFSFANYQNPQRTHFGAIRVINDDIIAAGSGFDMHPHKNMEIITYVRKGAISHQDTQGNKGLTEAGSVQVMSAGTGIYHSEFNLEEEETSLYQIWIMPDKKNVSPRWEQRQFPDKIVTDSLHLLVSGDPQADALFIHQQAEIYAGRLSATKLIKHNLKNLGYLLVSKGKVAVNGVELLAGDGAEIEDTTILTLIAITDAEILLLDVPEIT